MPLHPLLVRQLLHQLPQALHVAGPHDDVVHNPLPEVRHLQRSQGPEGVAGELGIGPLQSLQPAEEGVATLVDELQQEAVLVLDGGL